MIWRAGSSSCRRGGQVRKSKNSFVSRQQEQKGNAILWKPWKKLDFLPPVLLGLSPSSGTGNLCIHSKIFISFQQFQTHHPIGIPRRARIRCQNCNCIHSMWCHVAKLGMRALSQPDFVISVFMFTLFQFCENCLWTPTTRSLCPRDCSTFATLTRGSIPELFQVAENALTFSIAHDKGLPENTLFICILLMSFSR